MYTPLEIIEGCKEKEAVIKALSSGEPFNLDEFMNWILSESFCKRSYEGPFSLWNRQMLKVYEARKKKGDTYKAVRDEYRAGIGFTTILECFEKYKQVYCFDTDFLGELLESEAVAVPVDVLKRLPVRCFYLDLEKEPRFSYLAGIFVYVGFHENACNLGLTMVRKEKQDGQNVMKIFCISEKDMVKWHMLKINEAGEKVLHLVKEPGIMNLLDLSKTDAMYNIMLFILQASLYLSSNKPDMTDSPKKLSIPKAKKIQAQISEPKFSVTEVGIRYGAVIRKAKEQKTVSEHCPTVPGTERMVKSRKPMASHVRAAHWHHYWVGKGRIERIVKWIPPTFVCSTGKELPITIHEVKR